MTLAPETRRTTPSSALFHALRPKQWVKNVLVAAAPLAAGAILEPDVAWATVVAFVAFVLASSATYCLNDVLDAEADARHPTKRTRPDVTRSASSCAAAPTLSCTNTTSRSLA